MVTFLYYRLNMCVKLFLVVLKSRQVNLSVMLLLNLFVNLFLFVNSLVYLYLLKASVALLIVFLYPFLSFLALLINFDLVNKVNINTRCSVSVCRKVRTSVLVGVSTKIFRTLTPDVVNVTIAPPYQHFISKKTVRKSVLSVSAVSFIPAPTLTVNSVMSLPACNVLISVNTTCRVRNVSPYIPLSVNTSTPLVNYVSHNVRHVQRSKFVSFKSKVSVTSKFKYVSSSPLYTIFVAILFNTFFFTQSTKTILVCYISLLLYFY